VELDSEKEAIVTIGAKDALAHLLFATIGPGDVVVSPNPAYPIHQYGVLMAEGHACMLPMPDAATFLNALEDLYRTSTREAQDAADFVPAQSHHHLRGPRFLPRNRARWRASTAP
jgi:aspartate/methionine/tyrosine aminotransferase